MVVILPHTQCRLEKLTGFWFTCRVGQDRKTYKKDRQTGKQTDKQAWGLSRVNHPLKPTHLQVEGNKTARQQVANLWYPQYPLAITLNDRGFIPNVFELICQWKNSFCPSTPVSSVGDQGRLWRGAMKGIKGGRAGQQNFKRKEAEPGCEPGWRGCTAGT